MKAIEIIKIIKENGGFNNWRHWSEKEIAWWVYCNYPCTKYTAKQVAKSIK